MPMTTVDQRGSTEAHKQACHHHLGPASWPWPAASRGGAFAEAADQGEGRPSLPCRRRASDSDLSSAWNWSVKNTFVEVREDGDSDDLGSLPPDSPRAYSDPGAPRGWQPVCDSSPEQAALDDWADGLDLAAPGSACNDLCAGSVAWAAEPGIWSLQDAASGDVAAQPRRMPQQHLRVSASASWTWRVKNTFVEVGGGEVPNSPCGRRSDPGSWLLDAAWLLDEDTSDTRAPEDSDSQRGKGLLAEWSDDDDDDAMRVWAAHPAAASVPPPPKPFVADDGEEEQEEEFSVGSIGHPVLCTLMCRHLEQGHCPSGAACGFCHHLDCHTRRKQLDKKNRDTFRRMPPRRKLDVMLPILRSKVQALDSAAQLAEALEAWWASVAGEFPAEQDDPSLSHSRERRLENFLRCMSITDLCNLPGPQDGPLKGAAHCLLEQLRGALPASRGAAACASL